MANLVQDLLKVDNRDNIARLKGEVKCFKFGRCNASTRETWPAAPLHCVSHNVFRVDLKTIENHVLRVIVLLLSPTTSFVFGENRVKRSAKCGCIVERSSLTIV